MTGKHNCVRARRDLKMYNSVSIKIVKSLRATARWCVSQMHIVQALHPTPANVTITITPMVGLICHGSEQFPARS